MRKRDAGVRKQSRRSRKRNSVCDRDRKWKRAQQQKWRTNLLAIGKGYHWNEAKAYLENGQYKMSMRTDSFYCSQLLLFLSTIARMLTFFYGSDLMLSHPKMLSTCFHYSKIIPFYDIVKVISTPVYGFGIADLSL